MESLWKEIRRGLVDSVSELDRLIEQINFLAEKWPFESLDLVSSNLEKAKEKLGKINEINRIYSGSVSREASRDGRPENRASIVNEGEFWTISWDRKVVRMKGSKGVRLLAVIIENPGRQFHVMDLERYEGKQDPNGDYLSSASSDGWPILDRDAKSSYRARLEDLREELEEAEKFNDIFRTSKIKEEIGIITDELARNLGLFGRSRRALSDGERARVRVTLAVKGAIERISKHNPAIGWHLSTSVRTGAFCLYRPAPIAQDKGNFEGRDF
jgi:hypothetical protein